MCYDVKVSLEAQLKRAKRFGDWAAVEEIMERLAPMTDLPIHHSSGFNHPEMLIYTDEDPRFPVVATWGLVPHWVSDEEQMKKTWNNTLNARGETIFEKPSFRESARHQRCLIYIDGFYEHHHYNKNTYPFYIYRKDKEPIVLAGLWNEWKNPDKGSFTSFSIVTTSANEILTKIHNNPKLKAPRMPLILTDETEEKWLNPISHDSEIQQIESIIQSYPNDLLSYHTVKRLRGKEYLGNVPEISDEVVYEELVFE